MGSLNSLDDVHAGDHPSEHRKSLAVGVALAAEVHFRLVANRDGKRGRGRVRAVAGHRHRAVDVLEAGRRRWFHRDWRKLIAPPGRIDLELDHLDLDVASHGVVRPDRAIDHSVVVELVVHVPQKVLCGHGRVLDVDRHRDAAEPGLEDHEDRCPLRRALGHRGSADAERPP
jgi:hypothetical protein